MRSIFIVIFIMISSSSNAGEIVEHVCGSGEQKIKVVKPRECKCEREKLKLNDDDTYTEILTCEKEPCTHHEFETWTDWPECGGELIDGVIFTIQESDILRAY